MGYLNEDGLSRVLESLKSRFGILTAKTNYGNLPLYSAWGETYIDIRSFEEITYNDLGLKTQGGLTPGRLYRITDYSTCLDIGEAQNIAQRPFDIVVMATSPTTLAAEAYIVPTNEGDDLDFEIDDADYLSQLKVWYDMDRSGLYRPDWCSQDYEVNKLFRLRQPLKAHSVMLIDRPDSETYDAHIKHEQFYALSFNYSEEGGYELRLHMRRLCNDVEVMNNPFGYAIYIGDVGGRSFWKEWNEDGDNIYIETRSLFQNHQDWLIWTNINGYDIQVLGKEVYDAATGKTEVLDMMNSKGGQFPTQLFYAVISKHIMHYTGRITRMVDAKDNDCDYDFMNVLRRFSSATSFDEIGSEYYDYTFGLGFQGEDSNKSQLVNCVIDEAIHSNKIRNSWINIVDSSHITSLNSQGVVKTSIQCELIDNAWITVSDIQNSKFQGNDSVYLHAAHDVSIISCYDSDISNAEHSTLTNVSQSSFEELSASTIHGCNNVHFPYIGNSILKWAENFSGDTIDYCQLSHVTGTGSFDDVINTGGFLAIWAPDNDQSIVISRIEFKGNVTIAADDPIWDKLQEGFVAVRTCATNSQGEIKLYCEADLIA